jgi:hypothetical protein
MNPGVGFVAQGELESAQAVLVFGVAFKLLCELLLALEEVFGGLPEGVDLDACH